MAALARLTNLITQSPLWSESGPVKSGRKIIRRLLFSEYFILYISIIYFIIFRLI